MRESTTLRNRTVHQTIVMMYGHPASGKTTTAILLAAYLKCELIQTCTIRQAIFGSGYDTVQSRQKTHEKVYSFLLQRASEELALGRSIVLDGTFKWRWQRKPLYQLANSSSYDLVVAECVCTDFDTVKLRMGQRCGRSEPRAEGKGISNYQYHCRVVQDIAMDPELTGLGFSRLVYDTHRLEISTPLIASVSGSIVASALRYVASLWQERRMEEIKSLLIKGGIAEEEAEHHFK